MQADHKNIRSLNDPKLQSSELIFDGHILQLYLNQLKLENGAIVEREIIHHLPAVCVLATNNEKVILVKQYRPAIVDEIYEVPAGLLDIENNQIEEPLLGAKRELEEETDYRADNWKELNTFFVSPGYLDEQITLFHAWNLHKVEDSLPQDENENVTVHEFTKDEIRKMITNGEIVDIKTLFALQYWLSN